MSPELDRHRWRPGLAAVLLVSLLQVASATAAEAPAAPGDRWPVQARTLANGLKVLVLHDDSIPSATLYTFFRVGSRNEVPGRTGLAHFFEHMMFNGAAKYGPGDFDRVMQAAGGSNNAFTTRDLTAYSDWFPVAAFEQVLALEADRVGALTIDPKMVASERGVVLQERRLRTDGPPAGQLRELFYASVYMAHPYRWPVIGWESDIRAWTQADLEQFHKVYYAPNNAVMVLVGAVPPERAFAAIEAAFGALPSGPAPEPVRTQEPPQRGERRAELRRPAQLSALQIGYHVPPSADSTAPLMKVLETLLMAGQSSRLYKRLVLEEELALSVGGGYGEWNLDPTLFTFSVQVKGDRQPAQVEQAIYAELERLAATPPPPAELRKATNIVLADLYRSQKTIDGKALILGIFEIVHGDWQAVRTLDQRIAAVTAEQLSAFVAKYLVARNRTVVTLVPEAAAAPGGAR